MSKQTIGTIEADTSTWLTLDMDKFANKGVRVLCMSREYEISQKRVRLLLRLVGKVVEHEQG